jgi:rare lipoprotein A (peptidoglycan hydrolase)
MKALARGLSAAALLLNLAACADLGALGHVHVGAPARDAHPPLAHSFAVGHAGAEPAAIVAPVQLPVLVPHEDDTDVIRGPISWYGKRFAGRPTANGEIFDPAQMTMAHRELPFGTRVRVTNPANGASVVVRVNDRGPFVGNRVADLSHGAAKKLGMVKSGVIAAELEVLDAEPASSSARSRGSNVAPEDGAPVSASNVP